MIVLFYFTLLFDYLGALMGGQVWIVQIASPWLDVPMENARTVHTHVNVILVGKVPYVILQSASMCYFHFFFKLFFYFIAKLSVN